MTQIGKSGYYQEWRPNSIDETNKVDTMTRPRITVFNQASPADGRMIIVPDSLPALLLAASAKLRIDARRLFVRSSGAEVDDVECLRDDDVLVATEGTPLIRPSVRRVSFSAASQSSSPPPPPPLPELPTPPLESQYDPQLQHLQGFTAGNSPHASVLATPAPTALACESVAASMDASLLNSLQFRPSRVPSAPPPLLNGSSSMSSLRAPVHVPSTGTAASAANSFGSSCATPPVFSGSGEYKLAVMGSGAVGKSAMTMQYVQGVFLADYDPTIEDQYQKHTVVDGRSCLVDVLDTAGQEDYQALQSTWLRERQGFLLVLSVADRSSIRKLEDINEQLLDIKCGGGDAPPPVLVVGNKCDVSESGMRQVSEREGVLLARRLGNYAYMETSAKTGHNIDAAFEALVRLMCAAEDNRLQMERQQQHTLQQRRLNNGWDDAWNLPAKRQSFVSQRRRVRCTII